MAIPFTEIPESLLVPGQYQEIDNTLAGDVEDIKRAFVVGIALATGEATKGQPVTLSGKDAARRLLGAGAPAAEMAINFLDLNLVEKLVALPLEENAAGVAAVYQLTVAAVAVQAGTLTRYIGGQKVQIGVATGVADSAIAANLVAAINALADMRYEAAVNGTNPAIVDLTSKVKGEVGNGLIVAASLFGETDPSGLTIAVAQTVIGTGNPSLTGAFVPVAGERYHYWVTDLVDAASLTEFGTELNDRYSADRQIGDRLFAGISGELGDDSTAGTIVYQGVAQNNPHIVLVPRGNQPHTAGAFVARYAANVVRALADDPAANTQGIEVPGLPVTSVYTAAERQTLLESGVATWRTDSIGTVLVERVVTTYNENSEGSRDTSYLDVQIVETVDAIRTLINATAAKRFRDWKLASTTENFGAGSRVMSPTVWLAFLVDLYQQTFIQDKQWCQDLEAYKASIIVEIQSGSKTRLNYQHRPVLIGQFLIAAGVNQFR